MKEVKVYSTSACPYCRMAKEYLNSRGVVFQDIDVAGDRSALEEMVKISGQMGVPVIVVDKEVVTGFDRDRLDALLQ